MPSPILDSMIFCIEGVVAKLQLPGNAVYDLLAEKSNILSDYIVPSYDVLHTQSKQYIVDDIISLMRERGSSHDKSLPWFLRQSRRLRNVFSVNSPNLCR